MVKFHKEAYAMLDEVCFSELSVQKVVKETGAYFRRGFQGLRILMKDKDGLSRRERLQRTLLFGIGLLCAIAYVLAVNYYALDIVDVTNMSMGYWWGFLVAQLVMGTTLICFAGNHYDLILEEATGS